MEREINRIKAEENSTEADVPSRTLSRYLRARRTGRFQQVHHHPELLLFLLGTYTMPSLAELALECTALHQLRQYLAPLPPQPYQRAPPSCMYPAGYQQPVYPQPGYAQPGCGQSVCYRPGYAQPAYPQPGYLCPQPTYPPQPPYPVQQVVLRNHRERGYPRGYKVEARKISPVCHGQKPLLSMRHITPEAHGHVDDDSVSIWISWLVHYDAFMPPTTQYKRKYSCI